MSEEHRYGTRRGNTKSIRGLRRSVELRVGAPSIRPLSRFWHLLHRVVPAQEEDDLALRPTVHIPVSVAAPPATPPAPPPRFPLEGLRGAIFDVDGVLTDTASLHRHAWGETFNEYFDSLDRDIEPFSDEDYLRLVDGRLRIDGARAVVEDRQLGLPDGSPDDGPEVASVAGLAARKDARYLELLASDGPAPYPTSVAFLQQLRDAGLVIAIATASLHGKEVLRLAGLEESVDAVVDGHAAKAMGLAGKPAPDTFLEAAARLGIAPGRCVVIEDARSGVAAGIAAGCRVIGVDRAGDLADSGAEAVVDDLGALEISGSGPIDDPYLLYDEDVDEPEREGVRESLLTLGNGYYATRGARLSTHDDGVHYPGTYLAGIYDRLRSSADGREVDEEAIVNAPNWLALSFAVEGGAWLGEDGATVHSRGAILDMERGLLERRFEVVDEAAHRTSVLERRFVSMADPHLGAIEVELTAENWAGHLELRAGIDGRVTDAETVEERLLGDRHLELLESGAIEPDGVFLSVRTVQSQVTICEGLRIALRGTTTASELVREDGHVARRFSIELAEGGRASCEKVVAIHTSRDAAISHPLDAAIDAVRMAGGFDELVGAHEAEWRRIWNRAEIEAHDGSISAQRLINLNLFHVLQVASRHVVHRDVGLGARGLHGEGYLGHVFWDELFVLPILNLRFPRVARSLLGYRTARLDAARAAARAESHRGAMFPWQSASDGGDETPRTLYNTRSGHWMEDRSRYQRHVGLAVAYNCWQYLQATGDTEQLFESGLEVIVEVARFFADLAEFDENLDRYRIRGVMGPDEFHDGYPWSDEPGIDDNAYTNVMTAWLLERVAELVDLARRSGRTEALDRIGLEDSELLHFEEISRRLHVPFIGDVLAQFDGYDRLEPLDLDAYRARYGDIARLDLILEAEGDTIRRYQVGKQPDALMLFYLFSAEELRAVLGHLGYSLDTEAIRHTIEYYSSRVTHGSSLSRVVHAWITARLDRRSSWQYLSEALSFDLLDMNRGTTREGIHLGAMAGTIDIFERCYTGLETRSDALFLNPALPDELESLSFPLSYRGHRLTIAITHRSVEVSAPPGPAGPVTLLIAGDPYTLRAGDRITHEVESS